jgi:SAM-dependent methyltransferase
MDNSAKDIVRSGYDVLGPSYREHFTSLHKERYAGWAKLFSAQVPLGGRVAELGCADGIPMAQELATHFRYVGFDLSAVQIAAAQRQVPAGVFIQADMTQIGFPGESLDGLIALYSIIHVPFVEQGRLFENIYSWLKPGAIFMSVVGAGKWTGTANDWILPGTTMYWSHGDVNDYQGIATTVGFSIEDRYFLPEGDIGHTFLLLRKPPRP